MGVGCACGWGPEVDGEERALETAGDRVDTVWDSVTYITSSLHLVTSANSGVPLEMTRLPRPTHRARQAVNPLRTHARMCVHYEHVSM